MPNEVKTVQSLAGELFYALTKDKRNDGKEFVKLKDDSPQWMTEVIHEVHGEKLPDDTVYGFIERCTEALHGYSIPNSAHDAVYEIEPDIYTNDLTAWLHARVDHVYYLTEVLEEYGGEITDGFKLLMLAQARQIQEVGLALISALEKQVEAQGGE